MLASALVFRRRRYLFSSFEDLQWGIPQVAQDDIRLKVRLLFDSFEGHPNPCRPQDMFADDFTEVPAEPPLSAADLAIIKRLASGKNTIHQGTVHLTWHRLNANEPNEQDRKDMDEGGMLLLRRTLDFVDRGVKLGNLTLDATGEARYKNVRRLYDLLRVEPPVDEKAAKRPPEDKRINIETLTLESLLRARR